ncbi:nucleolar DEAD-box protein required for synthesis of 60S ribosomal subunit, partial [Linderina pennispora]
MSTADDFIMTINDDDEVPDLEESLDQSSDEEPQPAKAAQKRRKAYSKDKHSKKAKAEAGDIAKGFMVDLDTDGLDAVPQTLDFTLARASLKKRKSPDSFSTLDEKIAAARRAARIAKKTKQVEEDGVEKESESEDEADEEGDESEAGVEAESGDDKESAGPEDKSDDGEESESESEESSSESESESESESDVSSDSESEVDEVQEARKRAYFAPTSEVPEELPEAFTNMNLSRQIMKGLAKLGFEQPTAIQAKTIPVALLGKDVCGGAQTGSGKTAAFFIPMLERLLYRPKHVAATRVLVLCPTRELAIQCHNVGTKLAGFTDISMCLCVGGLSLKLQESELKLRPDIVIATPGRLIDHLRNSQSFHLDQIEILVMDEADRMLDDGFEDELTEIIKSTPKKRQTMLFSATMTDNVDKLIRLSLNKP